MKYIILLGDGMADWPLKELNNKTPLDVAKKSIIDDFAKKGELGIVKTVPDGMKPGSDVANLSLMGYNPHEVYTGRSPLEAENIGIHLSETDLAIRCNLVSLSDDIIFENKTMVDYSSSEISTEEASELLMTFAKTVTDEDLHFYAGTSYRNCMVVSNAKDGTIYTPPHDISLKKIGDFLPKKVYAQKFVELMKKSYEVLHNHPINIKRIEKGLNPANCIWLWGEGRKPKLKPFFDMYNKKARVISAVDLIKGIGICAEMKVISVDGATGTLSTNYENKAKACIDALLKDDLNFVYLHVEASDECGHQGDIKGKILAIENLNNRILSIVIPALQNAGQEFSILVAPDHPTPIAIRTHDSSPVPYVIYRSNDNSIKSNFNYNETDAIKAGNVFTNGPDLLKHFFEK